MKKHVLFMLTLVGLLVFSIGSYSCASTTEKHDIKVKIEKSISFEKAVMVDNLVIDKNFSVDRSADPSASNSEMINGVKAETSFDIKTKDLKPDCINASHRFNLKRKFYCSHYKYGLLSYHKLKNWRGYNYNGPYNC